MPVAVSVADSADLFDEQVDCLGGSVAGAAGVEVGQVLAAPGGQGAADAGDFGYGALVRVAMRASACVRPAAGSVWA